MIWCVDDDNTIRDIEVYALTQTGFEAKGFADGISMLEALKTEKPELIVLDIMLPGKDGVDVLKEIRSNPETRKIPVIMATAKGTEMDKIQSLDTGADDYLVKPFDVQEVLLRIKVLLRRNNIGVEESPLSKEILRSGDIEIFPESLEAVVVNKKVKLTPTEFEILYCLMQHFNNSVTLATLLDEVWGYDSSEDVRMLRVHVGGLRNKIEPDAKKPKYLHTVTNVGYKLTPFC